MMSRIFLQTIGFNIEKTVHRCIDSILTQTYSGDIDWYILDNGSTDGTCQILKDYSAKYPFIHVSHIDVNCFPRNAEEHRLWDQFTKRSSLDIKDDDFYCTLDGDDAYQPEFFDEMLAFINEYNLDVAVAGNDFLDAENGAVIGERKLEQNLILNTPEFFRTAFPVYHSFMRPVWGKLYKGYTLKGYMRNEHLVYGSDTHFVFYTLRQASRAGILNKSLYKYYVNQKSVSYQYKPERFTSDVYLYNDAIDFLSAYGPISRQNRSFLQCVYANAVFDTVNVINKSALSPVDKLREYRTIAAHPLTQAAYRECTDPSASRSRANLLQAALNAGMAAGEKADQDLRAVTQLLSPRCGLAISGCRLLLFAERPGLVQALLEDDPGPILEDFLARLEKGQGTKKLALPEAIRAMAADNPLLCQIADAAFLRKYGDIYRLVWRGETFSALEQMTGLLLEDRVTSGKETFFQLYVSLAAVEGQAPAFVFGKIQLAKLYLRQERRKDCRMIADELVEMGVDNEDLIAIRQELGGAI